MEVVVIRRGSGVAMYGFVSSVSWRLAGGVCLGEAAGEGKRFSYMSISAFFYDGTAIRLMHLRGFDDID